MEYPVGGDVVLQLVHGGVVGSGGVVLVESPVPGERGEEGIGCNRVLAEQEDFALDGGVVRFVLSHLRWSYLKF